MCETLEALDSFLKKIKPRIEAITGEERDIKSFMKLMRIFNEVGAASFMLYGIQGEGRRQEVKKKSKFKRLW